jgi:molybdopterin synthase sulfur carrier subunit
MACVHIPPQMRDLTHGGEACIVSGATLRQVIAELEARFPGIGQRLASGDRISPGLAIVVDGTTAARGLFTEVRPDSQIHIVPAIGGG